MTWEEVRATAHEWLLQDTEPAHCSAILGLIEAGKQAELQELFHGRLQFGTAGLRGEMGPGPNRMNVSVVRRTSIGIARYLAQEGIESPSVVIGYDARHGSELFAKQAAACFFREGVKVYLFDVLVPTPLLAHAVVELKASAGVMVTASHNPPKDNGYKVYWSNGAQIIPPHDKGIAAVIDALPMEPIEVPLQPEVHGVPDAVVNHYLAEVQKLRVRSDNGATVVYTPMHGVGGAWVKRALEDAGYQSFHMVPSQAEPDGDFPTVAFPNPEEPGAMDAAMQLGEEVGADVVLANDPDADRLAVALPTENGYQKLTGDQIGLILAEDLLRHHNPQMNALVATTVVSSSQLKDIAEHHGAAYAETLTGFKWIANKAIEHDAAGGQFVLGFEEALGYSAGSVARDKDGVSAALLLADLVSSLKSEGSSLLQYLGELYLRHGFSLSHQKSLRKPGQRGSAEISAIMGNLRDDPPYRLCGSKIDQIDDLLSGFSFFPESGKNIPIDLPKSDVLVFKMKGERIVVRPSGTEPKIKFYFEVRKPLSSLEAQGSVAQQCRERIDELQEAMLKFAEV
jgi:phosphomannomutase